MCCAGSGRGQHGASAVASDDRGRVGLDLARAADPRPGMTALAKILRRQIAAQGADHRGRIYGRNACCTRAMAIT